MRQRRWMSMVLGGALLASAVVGAAPAVGVEAATPVATSAFTPLAPSRILDTRSGIGAPAAALGAGGSITLRVAGAGGVPATGATAVALNLTLTESGGPGFATVWPAGSARPIVSNLNATGANQTIANLVIVALPPSGEISLFSQTGGHFVADVAGYWKPAEQSTAGRLITLAPSRVLDTREGNGASGPVPGNGQIAVKIAGRGGVPASGASAVVMNVTVTEAAGPGYVTSWPSDRPRPMASVLNAEQVGDTIPNLVLMPLSADGRVSFYTQTGGHLIADVAGYFTNGSAASSSTGLFVPLSPKRILDSRSDAPISRVWPGQRRDVGVAGAGGVPATNVGAAVLNLTATDANAAGYVTAYPAVTTLPTASNLNLAGPGATRANLSVAPLGQGGKISLYSQQGTHMIADVAGYFLGQPLPATPGVPVNPPPPPAPALIAPPRIITQRPCGVTARFASQRIEVHPGLAAYLTSTNWDTVTLDQVQNLAATFMANSGPLAAYVGAQSDFAHWIDNFYNFEGSVFGITEQRFLGWMGIGMHETLHWMQRGCVISGVGTSYDNFNVGPAQSSILADVRARLAALTSAEEVNDPFTCAGSAMDTADVYLNPDENGPGSNAGMAAQGMSSQLNEINAYVLELELERGLADALNRPRTTNLIVVSAKLHQLARYLNYSESIPGVWDAMRAGGMDVAVADHWNLAVTNWTPQDDDQIWQGCWDIAFGPDASSITRFTNGAAGTWAPPRP